MNILIEDLLAAAGPVIADGLNALPEPTRKRVADAHENGGWCELRVGVLNEAATVRLVLCNVDGQVVELMKVDHLPH